MRNRALYSIIDYPKLGIVAVLDEFDDNEPSLTVTNDAENVIAELARAGYLNPGKRVIYRDTEGFWDELQVKDGRFAGFAPIRATTFEAAVAKIGGSQMSNWPPRTPEAAAAYGLSLHEGYVGIHTRDEAEGAIPNGTGVVKVAPGRDGGGAPVGGRGTVLGSILAPPELSPAKHLYFVEWDVRPGFAVGVVDFKIAREP